MLTALVLIIFSLLVLGIFLFIIYRLKKDLKETRTILNAIRTVNKIILNELDFEFVTQKVADAIPNQLAFATGVLAIYDEQKGILKRVAASRTTEAEEAIKALKTPFNQIEISVNDPNNLMAKAIREKKSFITHDVFDVLGPVISKEESRKIQEIMSTNTTVVYPILMDYKPIGVFVASTKKGDKELTKYELEIIQDFVDGAAIALQHSILYKEVKDKTELLKLANDKLKVLDKLKDDFVSVASHELRTPMTAIKSFLWMAMHRSDVPLSAKVTRYIDIAYISTERLINLVNDMLNVSRIEGGRIEVKPVVMDVQNMISEVISEITPKIEEKGIKISFLRTTVSQIYADPEKIHQVFLNLIGNALKFTPAGGTVGISFFSDGKMVETSIKDSGVGISQDDLSRLFKKFSRLDSSYIAASTSGGTGLGLYICKSLVELMKGKIWVSSDGVGKGSTFTFSLPVATKEIIAQSIANPQASSGMTKHLEPVAI